MSDVTVAKLENHKKGLEHAIRVRDAAIRLQQNADYKLVIGEGFMLHEAARYAHASGDPMLSANDRADSLALAQASGHLKRYLHVTTLMGDKAEADMPDLDATLVSVMNGED